MAGQLLAEMTWPEIRDAAAASLPVAVTIGSTEQHGPHLPVSTDVLLPLGVLRTVAEHVPLVIAPPIHYGARSRALSGGGETFPGTLSLRGTTLMDTVEDVVLALARSGFRQICLQCWHWENRGFLWEPCHLAHEAYPEIRILLLENAMPDFSPEALTELFPDGFPGWDVEHASIMETSMMMVLHPELVREDRIIDDEAARHPSWDVIPAPPDFIPASGVLWHPSVSTPELGRKFIDAAATRVIEALRTEFDLPASA